MRFPMFRLNPVTAKRLKRFRSFKRAWISFWVLCALYLFSLCAEIVCNSRPLVVRHKGRLLQTISAHRLNRYNAQSTQNDIHARLNERNRFRRFAVTGFSLKNRISFQIMRSTTS